MLLQSGLTEEWWADSVECYWNLRNFQDKLSDGKNFTKGGSNDLQPTNDSVWSDGRISPYLCKIPVATASVRLKSLARYILWICVVRGKDSGKKT